MAFVSASIYHKAVRLAVQEGLSEALLENHSDETVTGNYVPMDPLLEVYECAEKNLRSGFGLRQCKQLDSTDYGMLGLSWKTCLKAIDILRNVRRYMVLVTDDGSIDMEENRTMA
ncbi:MAG: hypothetical protein P8X57_15480, partial [Cyclobacteriaceae bacterium]